MSTSTLTLNWAFAPTEAHPTLTAVRIVRALGSLRPHASGSFELFEAKRMVDAMRVKGITIGFQVPRGAEFIVARAVDGVFDVDQEDPDVFAEDICVEVGIDRLERFANGA